MDDDASPRQSQRRRFDSPVREATSNVHIPLTPVDDKALSRQTSPVLPDDLIMEILLRLPVKSLLQFKCVCKSWKTLISDPQFAKNHICRSTADPSMTHQWLVSSTTNKHYKIVSFPVKPLFENPSISVKDVSFRMRHRYVVLGSCNGLLCLCDMHQGCVKLWNPSTRLKSKRSPKAFSHVGIITYHGFGYDQVNDKYKVLLVSQDFNVFVTKVFTFGANSWTTVQNFPCIPTTLLGKFVSGTLNWLAKTGVIVSFDLEKETYKQMLLPQQDGDHNRNHMLDVFRNCLCVCFESNRTHWVVWLMKEYGVAETWTKFMAIPCENLWRTAMPCTFDPLCILENGVFFVRNVYHITSGQNWCSRLVLYDSKNDRLDNPRILNKLGLCYVYIYHESLVSPL